MKNTDVKKILHKNYLMATNIKMEQSSGNTFGLPPTPPASLPSDESEGNQSPEHHSLVSPLSSPNIRHQTQQLGSLSSNNSTISIPASSSSSNSSTASSSTSSAQISNRRNTASTSSNTSQSSSSSNSPCNRGFAGSSTRQPIHTPLISSQPVNMSNYFKTNCVLLIQHFIEGFNWHAYFDRRGKTHITC